MEIEKYHNIRKHYENCLALHGDNHLGVDWPNAQDLEKRFEIMLDVIKDSSPVKLLDFGCGTGLLYNHLSSGGIVNIEYTGLDISSEFIDLCNSKYPDIDFHCLDVNKEALLLDYDYAICNGTFTEKLDLTFDEMFSFFSKTIMTLFNKSKKGIAFNVMSSHVDYERENLFHVPHDIMANFITKNLSRHYTIRNDYGLYEYTVYVYKEPTCGK